MDPLWTLRREISFLLSELLSSNVSSSGKSFGSRWDITYHTWSRVTKKSYFRLIFLCMPPSLACEYSRFSLILTGGPYATSPAARSKEKRLYSQATTSWAFQFLFGNLFNVFNGNLVTLVINPEITRASFESSDAQGVLWKLFRKKSLTFSLWRPCLTYLNIDSLQESNRNKALSECTFGYHWIRRIWVFLGVLGTCKRRSFVNW